jgi:Family of unknown function (DUF6526)
MEQSYRNHGQRTPAWIFGVLLPFFLNFIWALTRVIRGVTIETVLNLAMAVAFLILWWFVRRMALTVQDRVIRLEMRLRLRDVLPSSMHSDIPRLTRSQLVALRFASDQELAELVREVLAGKLASQKDIKLKIRDWQADYLRA